MELCFWKEDVSGRDPWWKKGGLFGSAYAGTGKNNEKKKKQELKQSGK